MKIIPTKIEGVNVVESSFIADHRGQFSRVFCEKELAPVLGPRKIVQINFSETRQIGALRGLHYQQAPYAEMKLIRCLKGRVLDVAVDLRANSPTLLQWHAEELFPASGRMMVIPEGCAHGFQVLEEDSQLLYMHTQFYEKSAEGGALYNDPLLAINWPLPVSDISERDMNHAPLTKDFKGLVL